MGGFAEKNPDPRKTLDIGFERAFENRKRANPKSENAHMKKKKKTRKKKKKKRAFEKPDARKKKRAFFFFFFKRAFEKVVFSNARLKNWTRVRKNHFFDARSKNLPT